MNLSVVTGYQVTETGTRLPVPSTNQKHCSEYKRHSNYVKALQLQYQTKPTT